jgi:flavin-dependent dehydrogenase
MASKPSEPTVDVVVIGGGPGGSTTATMLARQGWHVLLLEREHFPRAHVGESLLPATLPVLEELGVLPAVQAAGFLPKYGATMVWGRAQTPWSWYFRETNQTYPQAYQVWRPHFDQLLLEHSRKQGVEVRQGHQVVDVLFEDRRAVGVHYTQADGSLRTARARWIVDASGQGAVLGHQLGLRRWDPFFRNLAVYGYVTGAQRLPPPDETNIFIESYAHGWFWHIPLHTGWTSVGTVVDSRQAQEELRHGGATQLLHQHMAQAPYTAQMLQDAELVSGPFVVKDWSYRSVEVAGAGYVLVGDAACFVDPLFSSGVHLACMSGVLAAAYVTTVLKDPDMQEAAAQVYTQLYDKEYQHFHALARLFYSSNRSTESYFWEARRLLGQEAILSPRHAFIHAVAGQTPRGYERAVLAQGETPAAFMDNLRIVETARVARRRRVAALRQTDSGLKKLMRAVPRLADGVAVQRKPVLAAGEFVWGDVLITAGYPEGLPCSRLVAHMVGLIDARRSVANLLAMLLEAREATRQEQIVSSVLATLDILYVDGTIADLGLPDDLC